MKIFKADDVTATIRSGGISATEKKTLPKRIWLCADDYGIAPGVNRAIRDLIAHNRINATSVMVGAPSFSRSEAEALDAVASGARRPAIGLHVTLTAPLHPLSTNYRPTSGGTFLSLRAMLLSTFLYRLDQQTLRDEIAAQLAAFIGAFGRPPDFVDGHQHVHLFPLIRDAVLGVIKDKAPDAWLRQCGSASSLRIALSDRKGLFIGFLSRGFRRRAHRLGLRTNPVFAGTYDFTRPTDFAALFPTFLPKLLDDSVVMCHPGFVDDELTRIDPLTASREREYAYFIGEDFPKALESQDIALAWKERTARL